MSGTKLLLTGATGYIGGSVLNTLLSSTRSPLENLQTSVLVRREDQAKLLAEKGVNPILIKDLDDVDVIRRAASEHDVVVHTASGFHSASAKALILGLGDRKKSGAGKGEVHCLHTSGTSNLADQPITGKYKEDRVFSDTDPDIYGYEVKREKSQPYHQRTTDLTVVETGKEVGVKTYIIMSPTIYGVGTGSFNKLTMQIPSMIRAALKNGHASVIGEGKGQWDHVHVEDLAVLYELMLSTILKGGKQKLPNGEQGIYFSANGTYTWKDVSEGVAAACTELAPDRVSTKEVKSMSLKEGAKMWAGGDELLAELGFASNRDIFGWKPKRTQEDFRKHFRDETEIILKE
ncbi:MAG: hypothetical protein M1827_003753 [Pycnora praestabilis]|nr:MAG: hypothetical protein M1827_003753 [Pycnora praestabilis]